MKNENSKAIAKQFRIWMEEMSKKNSEALNENKNENNKNENSKKE